MGKRTQWFPDGKTDRSPCQMSATRASARSIRTRRCNSTPLWQQDAPRCLEVARQEHGLIVLGSISLEYVRDGDVMIVWKLDGLGRSLPHLIER